MKITQSSSVGALIVASFLFLSFFVGPTSANAQTFQPEEFSSTEDVSTVLEVASNAGLLLPAVQGVETSKEASVTKGSGVTLEIPWNSGEGVEILSEEFELTIYLPNANLAQRASKTAQGTLIFPSTTASSNSVIPSSSGVQMITTISNEFAPERYTYEVETSETDNFRINEDGSASLIDSSGFLKVFIPAPWAIDASGASIPTHYEVDGKSLTQVIEHTSIETVAYPIAADPIWVWFAGAYGLKFNKSETRNLANYGSAAGFCGALGRIYGIWCGVFAAQWFTQAVIASQNNQCIFIATIPAPLAIRYTGSGCY